MNCKAYTSFEGVSTDHRIVTAKIRLSLRKNANRTKTSVLYEWAPLKSKDIRDKYTLALRNKYDSLQQQTETHTPNEEYDNFINTHLEVAAEFIQTKQSKYRVRWETLAVREKRADMKTTSKRNRKNPNNTNALKLEKTQNKLANIYQKWTIGWCGERGSGISVLIARHDDADDDLNWIAWNRNIFDN